MTDTESVRYSYEEAAEQPNTVPDRHRIRRHLYVGYCCGVWSVTSGVTVLTVSERFDKSVIKGELSEKWQ